MSSPVVEVFVRGGVPREVRLLAARGLVTEDACDRLALLALMTADEDRAVADLAMSTVTSISGAALADFLERPDVPMPLREWYRARVPAPPPQAAEPAGAVRDAAAFAAPPPAIAEAPADATAAPGDGAGPGDQGLGGSAEPQPDSDDDGEVAHHLLTSLPVPEKIKLATLGRREQRAILIRDPNRIVASAVLASPKLTETEVELFARMQNVSEEVLRIIGMSRIWVKNYNIVAALVKNPRTPTAVSLPLLTRLQERDVKGLTVNRNIPESVRIAARKFLAVQLERRSNG